MLVKLFEEKYRVENAKKKVFFSDLDAIIVHNHMHDNVYTRTSVQPHLRS